MTHDLAVTFARLLDIWSGAPVDGLTALLTPDYRGHMHHLADGERDAAAYPAWITRQLSPGFDLHRSQGGSYRPDGDRAQFLRVADPQFRVKVWVVP